MYKSIILLVWLSGLLYAQDAPSDRIVFSALCENGEERLFIIDPDGQNLRQLSNAYGIQPVWLDAGKNIGYIDLFEGSWSPRIYSLEEDRGQGFGQMLSFQVLDREFIWDAGGSFLALVGPSSRADEEGSFLYIVDETGMNVNTPVAVQPYGVNWSPDVIEIAYIGEDNQIHILSIEGEDETVTEETGDILSPAWSPDATQIAYIVYDGESSEIHVLTLEDSSITTVALPFSAEDLIWSPDGTRLAVVGFDEETGSPDVYIWMLEDGEEWVKITDTPDYEQNLSWSPDSTRLVFSTLGMTGGLAVAKADGSGAVTLVEGLSISTPQWSPLAKDAEVSDPEAALPEEPVQLTCEE